MKGKIASSGDRVIARNKKAYHDYHVIESMEAGIALTGTEIKSVRAGKVSLVDGFATVRGEEVWLMNVHIAPYEHGNRENHEPRRNRKLLLHRREINRLIAKMQEKGWTLVPLKMYLTRNKAKIELGVVKGKRLYDKRKSLAQKDAAMDMRRAIKEWRN